MAYREKGGCESGLYGLASRASPCVITSRHAKCRSRTLTRFYPDALRYEAAIKADTFLVVVHGTTSDVARARVVLKKSQPIVFDVHHNIDMHARARFIA